MKRWIIYVLLLVMVSGCNTVAGVGKDIERGGEALQRGAQR